MPDDDDHGRVAALQIEVRDLRDEVQRLRSRYHDLSNMLAPLVLAEADTREHEAELRVIRSELDRLRGVWRAISVIATVVGALAAGAWEVVTHMIGSGGKS